MDVVTSKIFLLFLIMASCGASWWGVDEVKTFETTACKLPCDVLNTTILNCTSKQCHAIPDKIPSDVTELRLQHNNITNITKLSQSLEGLTSLRLEFNSISDLEEEAFENCLHLRHLNISYNKIREVKYAHFFTLNNLLTLDLSSNLLSYLESAAITFTNLKRLEELSLRNNLIEDIGTDSFTDLERLRKVDLSFNKLSHVTPQHLEGLTGLEYLDLRQNMIQTLHHDTFQDQQRLQTLLLTHNVIADIELRAFDYANNIRELDLSYNALETIPRALNVPNVEVLKLDNNPISEVNADSFGELIGGHLKDLSLSNCYKLRTIRQAAFVKLTALRNLLVHDSALSLIEKGAFNNTQRSIKMVNLRNNKLQTMEKDALNWPFLHDLDLSGNPWNCDCHLEWVIEEDIYSNHWNRTKCSYPLPLKGRPVRSLKWQNYTCVAPLKAPVPRAANNAFLIVIMATTVVFIVGIVIILYYNRRQICNQANKFRYVSLYNAKDPSLDGAVTVQYREDDEHTALTAPTQV